MAAGLRLLFATPLIAALSWAALAAVRAASVDEALAGQDRKLRSWAPMSLPPAGEWASGTATLDWADSLEPRNPAVHELKGLFAVRRSDDFAILGSAVGHYARALALRPVSASTWANLAEAKYLRGETDMTFERALSTAVAMGPAHPQAQRIAIHYGLAVWDELAAPTRVAVDAAVAAGMRRNPLETLQIAGRRGRLSVACRHLAGVPRQPDPRWSQPCQSREATR